MAPVVTASLGALGPVLVKLTGLLADKYGHLKGVRREIISLRCELSSIHAAMTKYTMLEDPDIQVKEWMSIVRELAYDIEDCIDRFVRLLGSTGRHGGFKEFFRKAARLLKTLRARHEIASQINELKAHIKHVKELKDSYKLSDTPRSTPGNLGVDPRLCALFAEEAHLVGVSGISDNLAEWMEEEGKKHRRVLSIVGFGGLGKTTLANDIYHKIQGRFDCWAFVSVSQKPTIKTIIKDLISRLSPPDRFTRDIDTWDEMISIEKLRELLQDKRYLVIVDDIWSTQAWNTIKCAFPENNCSSRIISTTRIMDVARSCSLGGDDRVFELKPLSDLHSRSLFLKIIFGSDDYCPEMLEEVSYKILKKCGGLPLAIISIAGVLASRPAFKEEWENIKRSIGSALEKDRSLEGMREILSLSYNELPPNLKTCLLYLSVFPEDCVIDRERLVKRWIAEGFISEDRGRSQQEVAESYFYELINKSMVQPVNIGYDGKARACRVHDMLLEIIISKSDEDNFITVLRSGQTILANRHGFIRRLTVQNNDQELASALANEDLSHVRSLTVTTSCCIKHLPSLVVFESLRVLDFEGCMGGLEEYDMHGMDKLSQLKYLGLKDTSISKLPSGIGMLLDLETLDFRNTYVKELPTEIVHLTKLHYLLASRETKIPSGIGVIRNLRVISGFNITRCPADVVADLGELTSLNQLNVDLDGGGSDEYKRHEEMLLSSLCKLSNYKLQSLQITRYGGTLELLDSWCPPPSSLQTFLMFSDYCFANVPKWIAPALTSLAYLVINLTELTEEGMCTLGDLPALLSLYMCLRTRSKDRVIIKGIGFLNLKEFGTFGVAVDVMFAEAAMPKLENIALSLKVPVISIDGFCLGIEYLTCLKQVEVYLHNEGATPCESKAAAVAIRNEADRHPNHPTIVFGIDDNEDT